MKSPPYPPPSPRTPGWLPVENLQLQGDPRVSEVLAHALTLQGGDQRLTHGFHTYPAGMHPDAAATLLDLVEGDSVLDPFLGGGTVMIEAMVRGRRAVGFDVNPVALVVSRGRTRVWPIERIQRLRSWGRRITRDARSWNELPRDPAARSVASWYEPHVSMELQGIRAGIRLAPEEVQAELRFAFSSILVKVSLRASDTAAQRVVRHRPPGSTAILFHKKVRELGRRLEDLAAAVPEGTPAPEIIEGDARELRPSPPVDAVVTSPPYPAVYDYVPLQSLRTAWLGLEDQRGRRQEIGSRRSFRRDRAEGLKLWSQDMAAWMRSCHAAVRPGGLVAVVIGDGAGGPHGIDSLGPLVQRARQAGLEPVAAASADRMDHGWGRARREHSVLLERT